METPDYAGAEAPALPSRGPNAMSYDFGPNALNRGYTQKDCNSQQLCSLARASCRHFRLNVRVTVEILSDLVHQII